MAKTNEKQKASRAKRDQKEERLMSKHFNYGVKNKMKGNICKQISVKVTFVSKYFTIALFLHVLSVVFLELSYLQP